MKQFIQDNKGAFQELEERAKNSCICFRNQEMPTGCYPARADIGFEVNSQTGAAKLLVSTKVRYSGQNAQIRQWLTTGQMEFSSFNQLKNWICKTLAPEFRAQNQSMSANSAPITDIAAVHQAIKDVNQTHYLDEEEIFTHLARLIRGQDEALKNLSRVVACHCARRHPKRPAVTFAIGPSGVGKTRTAEMLAKVLSDLGSQYAFLRLDMTEYQEAHRVSQLTGAPQGYIGHSDGSQLTDALRANPRTIILFDEIEKAHPAILRVLMNAMDAGRLSTASRASGGHQVDCRSAIFLFTSNLEAQGIIDELSNRKAFDDRAVVDEVCRRRMHAQGIAPEIIGRIGRFLVFQPLNPEIRAEIIAMAIAEIAEEYGVKVSEVEPSVIVDILTRVKSQNFGVRPERFIIDDLLGIVFAGSARQNIQSPIKVVGPPFGCEVMSGEVTTPTEQAPKSIFDTDE